MRYISGIPAALVVLALAVPTGAQPMAKADGSDKLQMSDSQKKAPTAEVVMKDQAFQITKGEGGKGIMVLSDPRVDITLRNEDTVAHEFVSPMLFNIPFRLSGNGTFVKLPKAAGVRVDPGQTVQLSFEVSQDVKEFQHLFEIFWCNVHGKQHGDKMRGEMLIVEQRGETGGG